MNSFFGTDGIRAAIGSALFTHQRLPEVALAVSIWLAGSNKAVDRKPRVVIIHDTRNACAYIKSIFKMVFLSQSIDVYDAGVVPTPAAPFLIEKLNADCALIISASHNPWHDNGIKIIDRSGKLDAHAEAIISKLIHMPEPLKINYYNFGSETSIDGATEYCNAVIPLFEKDFLSGIKIVLDCAHGATSSVAPKIFEFFGAELVVLNNKPDGFNINHQNGPLAPDILQHIVVELHALVGLAFDGDGDRVIAVNQDGIIKNGDDILALLSTHPEYHQELTLIGTIMSNIGFESWLNSRGKKLLRTGVGDKYVAQKLEESNALLGGEQSGHIILKNYTNTGDGILVALKILETMILTDNKKFETFVPYPQVLLTIPVQRMCDLSENPYYQLIEAAQKELSRGRVSVRYSGTEKNMLRIMVESELLHHAHSIAQDLATSLQKELS
jgi:phosphoglucosamine mutase